MASEQIIYILVVTIFGAHGITVNPPVWIEGETGSVTCTNAIAVIFRRNEVQITKCLTDSCDPPEYWFTTTVDDATDTAIFTIHSVSTRDAGTWRCDEDGKSVIDVKVKVSVDCRSTVVIVVINVVIGVFITVILVIHIYLICKSNKADNEGEKDVEVCCSGASCMSALRNMAKQDQWRIWLTECSIFVICDCCIAYSIYVLSEPVAECRDSLHWQLTIFLIVVVIILRLVLIYPIYRRLQHEPVCVRVLIILLFETSPLVALCVLFILYKILKKCKD